MTMMIYKVTDKVAREEEEENLKEGELGNSSSGPDLAKKQVLAVNCKVEIATALPQNPDNYGRDILTAFDKLGEYLHKIIPESPFNEQIVELNLTLPSRYTCSYIDLFEAENRPDHMLNFLYDVIVKFPKAKHIQFPMMRIEPANRFSEELQKKINSSSIKLHYDSISLNL